MHSGFISVDSIERIGAEIIRPHVKVFNYRYANYFPYKRGSRFINSTPCPLCEIHLRGQSCGTCPMDMAFGLQDGRLDNSGCKVWIRKMWGPITFGDFPNFIVSSSRFNVQLDSMHKWLRKTFKL